MSLLDRVTSITDRLGAWFQRLPTAALVAIGVVVLGVAGVGGWLLYETYDFVQHDNDFCLSCHLMVDPYERFARSAHRDLGCKACHRPTFAARSSMALAQVLEQPEEISAHAEVPNETCAECHIEGDPDKWETIATSAGHRVHLESDSPALEGLQCVECHSSSLHQFTAVDQTCGQSGCHENTQIRLGEMGQMTIHCAACHEFSTPVPETLQGDSLSLALQPQRQECLSCHAMRLLATDFPDEDPHNGACGACHQPHEQTTPAQAVERCGECHTQVDTLTAFHRGLAPGELEDCTQCHDAHDFRAPGDNCLSCHQGIFEGGGTGAEAGIRSQASGHPPVRPTAAAPGGEAGPRTGAVSPRPPSAAVPGAEPIAGALRPEVAARLVHVRSGDVGPRGPAPGDAPALVASSAPVAGAADVALLQQQDTTVRFNHGQHREVECTVCHSMEQTHGRVTVTGFTECRTCHHTAPVAQQCSRCHQSQEYAGELYRRPQRFDLTVAQPVARRLPFSHTWHDDIQCTACHTQGLGLAVQRDCASCHEEHHEAQASCLSCHTQPADGAHDRNVHVGCAGSGCHEELPGVVASVPRTRDFCLTCHQGLTDHRPGQNCIDCHALPAPRQRASAEHGREGPAVAVTGEGAERRPAGRPATGRAGGGGR